jgi:hypothetical protein
MYRWFRDFRGGKRYPFLLHSISYITTFSSLQIRLLKYSISILSITPLVLSVKMSEPKRAAYSGPTLTGPGILLSISRVAKPNELSDAAFNKWYNEVHIRDVLATGGVTRAVRFREANPKATSPYMAVYTVPDLSVIHSDAFKNIPMTDESLPGGGNIHSFANFNTRFYSLVQEYPEPEPSSKSNAGNARSFPLSIAPF